MKENTNKMRLTCIVSAREPQGHANLVFTRVLAARVPECLPFAIAILSRGLCKFVPRQTLMEITPPSISTSDCTQQTLPMRLEWNAEPPLYYRWQSNKVGYNNTWRLLTSLNVICFRVCFDFDSSASFVLLDFRAIFFSGCVRGNLDRKIKLEKRMFIGLKLSVFYEFKFCKLLFYLWSLIRVTWFLY